LPNKNYLIEKLFDTFKTFENFKKKEEKEILKSFRDYIFNENRQKDT